MTTPALHDDDPELDACWQRYDAAVDTGDRRERAVARLRLADALVRRGLRVPSALGRQLLRDRALLDGAQG